MRWLLQHDLYALASQSLGQGDNPFGAWLDAAVDDAMARSNVAAEILQQLHDDWARARVETAQPVGEDEARGEDAQGAGSGGHRRSRVGVLAAVAVAVVALVGAGVAWLGWGGCRAPARVEAVHALRVEGVGEFSLQPPGGRVTAIDVPGVSTPVEAVEIVALSDGGRGTGVAATLHARRGAGQQSLTLRPERGVIEVRARGSEAMDGWTVERGEAVELVIDGLDPLRLLAHVPSALGRVEVEGACWAGADDLRGLRVTLRDGAFEVSR